MTGPEPWLVWAGAGTRSCLTASIESFIRNAAEAGRSSNVAVALDIEEAELRQRHGSELGRIRATYGTGIRYSSRDLRTAACGRLSGEFDSDLLDFALLADPTLSEFPGPGANQNAMVLVTAGRPLITSDDDVYARPGRLVPGGDGATQVVYSDVPMPYRFRYFDSRESLLEAIPVVSLDIVGQHAALLGDRVRLTTAGAYGDSGMRSASSFLTLTGETREQHYGNYKTLRHTRELARIPETTVVGRSPHLMGAHFGVDNTRLTPPLLPVGRNADGLFGVTMRMMDPDSQTAFLGFGVLHDPPEPRTGDHADLVQVRPTPADVLIALSVFCRPPDDVVEPSDRLRTLGENLVRVSELSTGDYLEAVHSTWSRGVDIHVRALEQLLDTYNRTPTIWADDVDEHLENVYELLREPSAFFSSRRGPGSAEVMQLVTTQWGRLLSIWPDLWEYFAARNQDAADSRAGHASGGSGGAPTGEVLLVREL